MRRQIPFRISWRNGIAPLRDLHVITWLVSPGSKCRPHQFWTAGAFAGVCLIALIHSASVSCIYGMSRHRDRIQTQRSSCRGRPRVTTPFHSQCSKILQETYVSFGPQSVRSRAGLRQDFINALLLSGHRLRGQEPAFRPFHVYGLPYLREPRRDRSRKWPVVLWACAHGLLCHRYWR